VFVDPLDDQTADQVYGQANFEGKDIGTGLNQLRSPTGVGVDVGGRLWIADFSGRVLEFDAPLLGSNGRSADRTFGTTGQFPSAKRFLQPTDVDFDAFDNLYVADGTQPPTNLEGGYSRVLRLESPLTTDAIPDGVVGQKGFAASLPNRIDLKSLSVPRGIAFDRTVNPPHVYVADTAANRVLAWADATTFENGASADLVLGQPSFKAHYCYQGVLVSAAAANTLCQPTDIGVDSQGRVWVVDELNNRVVGYASPFASGMVADQPAIRVLGQADFAGQFANRGGAVGANTLKEPRSLAIDSDDNVWVTDRNNFRVLVFKKPFAQDGNADLVLGQANLTSAVFPAAPSADSTLASSGGTPGIPGSKGDRTGDRVFGQSSLTAPGGCNAGGRTAQSLCSPAGVALDAIGSLWVVDGSNHRVLRYDLPLTGDATADAAIGPPDFTTSGSRCGNALLAADGFCFPYGIGLDPSDNLWVSETGRNRVMVFDAS